MDNFGSSMYKSDQSLWHEQGFTLLEMVMVITILAILAMLATPVYQKFKTQQVVSQTSDQLRDHLELARAHAQSQHVKVKVCPIIPSDLSSSTPNCLTQGGVTQWLAWMVIRMDNGLVLARAQKASEDIIITSGQRDGVEFDERGMASSFANATISISSARDAQIKSELKIAPTGRVTQ